MDRETNIEDFQSKDSDKKVFILSTRAGGLGIDLFAANVVIIKPFAGSDTTVFEASDRAGATGVEPFEHWCITENRAALGEHAKDALSIERVGFHRLVPLIPHG